MHSTRLSFVVLALLTVLWQGWASAQTWDQPWSDPRDRPPRFDLNLTAGMAAPTDWSDLVLLGSLTSLSGLFEQVLVRDVRVEPDAVFGGSMTYWRDRYGFRAGATYSRSSLTIGGTTLDATNSGRDVLAAHVNTWSYDVRGVIGLIKYGPSRPVLPYVFLGVGGITYQVDRTITPPLLTFIQQPGNPPSSGGIVVRGDGDRQFVLAVDELGVETVPAFDFGVGSDFRVPLGGGAFGVRVEVSDHMSPSPLRVRIRELSALGGLTNEDAIRFGTVHELRVVGGLVVQIGR